MAAGDQRRPARGRGPGHRLRPALGPEGAAAAGPGGLRGPRLPHRRVAPRRRPRRQAGRRDRHRLQRDPGRCRRSSPKSPSSTSTSARPAGRCRRGTTSTRAGSAPSSAAFRLLRRLDRASVYAFQELAAAAFTRHRWLLPLFRALGTRQIKAAISDPELRRKVTPSYEFGCKRIMLTDEWYPTLTRSQRRAGRRADRRGHAERHPRRDRGRAPGRRDRPRHRLRQPRLRRADGDRRQRAAAPWRRPGPRWRAPTSASACPASPTCSCSTGRTRTAAAARSSTRSSAAIGHVLAALREMERERREPDRGSATRRPRASTASCAPPSPDRLAERLQQLVRRRERQRPEQLALDLERLPAPHGASSCPAPTSWRAAAPVQRRPRIGSRRDERAHPQLAVHAGERARLHRRQLSRRPRHRADRDRGLLRQRPHRRRQAPPASRRLRPRRRLDRARRHRRRLGDLPQHPAADTTSPRSS